MSRIFRIFGITLLCLILCMGNLYSQTNEHTADKTQVVIMGTLHEFHYNNPEYPPEVLKEIILALKPDAILDELPLSLVDPNGRPIHHDYLTSPEGWASYTAAIELGGIPQIPFDRPDRQENFKKTNYFERQKKSSELTQRWFEELRKKDPNSLELKIAQIGTHASYAQADLFDAAPEVINCEAFDLLIKIKHSVWKSILPDLIEKYPNYKTLASEDRFFAEQWNVRNRIMADNIIKAAKQYPGKRLVVITGAEHRYILRDLLKDESGIDLKEYWEIIDFDLDKCLKSLPPPPIPEIGIFGDGLTKEQASQKVAKEYWEAIINKDWGLVNKLRPPVAGVNWQEKYSQNMPVELLEVKEAFWPEGQSFGPLAPCVVKFADGRVLEINIIPQFRTIRGKTMCFITGTWGKHREINNIDSKPHESNEPNQPAYLKPIPPEKLKEDLDFLFKTIEEVHPNMYAYVSQEKFKPLKEQLYESISSPMKPLDFYKAVAPVIAQLKNGHMNLGLPDEFEAYIASGGKVFPLKFYWDGDKAILSENRGHEVLPMGDIVETINNQEVGMLLQRLGKYRADECKNNDEFFAGTYLHRYLWLEYGNADLWKLRIKDINGKASDYVVKGIPWEEYLANNPHKPNFAYEYLVEYNTALIRFKSCFNLKMFAEFLKETFQEIKEREVSNLIIDIRHNVGGESTLVYALLDYITDKPFRMGDKCDTKISRQMYGDDLENIKKEFRDERIEIGSIVSMEESLVQPNDNPLRFKGKCYLLIDRLVFSSGCQFASVVKCFNIATVIGEETWGTTAAYGAIREHILPNSGLKFYVPSKYIVQACGKPDGRGVIPDYEVKQKPEDTAKGVDTVLQFTLNLIKESNSKAPGK